MKRSTLITVVGIVLLFGLAAAVSGERIVSDGQKPAKVEQKNQPATTISTSTPAPSPVFTEGEFETVVEPTPPAPADANAYSIPWQSINAGGDDMQSTNYQMMSSVGQSVIGYATSDNYQTGMGYWYGMGGDDCFCGGPPPSFGDITCDAAVNPVDVVKMVNYVYKNIEDRCSDGWNCPYEPGDVNCDNAVNPVDVVRYVNYVYKNITPFPCDPCS